MHVHSTFHEMPLPTRFSWRLIFPADSSHHGDRGTDDSSTELDTTLIVRDSFLCCMAELLGGICGYLRKSEARRSRHSLR